MALHLDNLFEDPKYGGERILTFMIYLSTVSGGNTVFPLPGISIQPEVGKALLWFNVSPQQKYDARTFHLACPVLYGSKWIVTKWHRWVPSFQKYPCYIEKDHFSIFQNS